ncbi:MAG: hypothetical protein KF851_04140 [Pirellulaceae bacterium]|nr:hypothetical protein [Pirellulaceae bacterium]
MSSPVKISFTEDEIQGLFGDEAADFEGINRLRSYYFKTPVYEQFRSSAPLRVLVGHKGIGKSALFRISMCEDRDNSVLSILIRPDDIADIGGDTTDFLRLIRSWKMGLNNIIIQKVLNSLGTVKQGALSGLANIGGKLLEFVRSTVRDTESFSLDPAKKMIVERFASCQSVNVYIDDLDRGWQGRREDIQRISALLNAMRDITQENAGIRFRISLRSDVYFLVRTADESTDKIEGSVLWQAWNNHEIFALLVKRIETYFGRTLDDSFLQSRSQFELATYLSSVMEEKFKGQGKWQNAPMHRVLLSLIRARPRDLVKLCTLAAREARKDGATRILTGHFSAVFNEYSQGRVQDTINEFRSELPEIERLLFNMKPVRRSRTAVESYVFSTDQLLKKIGRIQEQGQFKFAGNKLASAKQLAGFMYKINFLTGRREVNGEIQRFYFEQNRYLSNEFADFGYHWEIHPAYRWALQPDGQQDIFSKLELSAN